MLKLSIQNYASTRGKSRTAVYKAIKEGRIREAIERNDRGKLVLDAELADLELERNTEPAMLRDPDAIRAGIEANREPTAGPLFKDEPPAAEPEKKPTSQDKTGGSLLKSREALTAYDARMRRLDYEERIGKLVGTDAIKVELFRSNRMIRDALLSLPGNIAPRCVGEPEEKIRAVLTSEIMAVLKNLSDEFKVKE